MEAGTIDAIDNFINDASDQAAAWWSITQDRPVALPSAQIAVQRAQAQAVATQPVMGFVRTPIGTSFDVSTIVLIAGAALVAYLVLKG